MSYEPLFELEKTGVELNYYTNVQKYNPSHWHSAIELIYILNGNLTIMIEGQYHPVVSGEFIVIDSNRIHELRYNGTTMLMTIHFSRSSLKNFIPDLEDYHFHCTKDEMVREQLESYFKVCDILKKLPPLYILQPLGYQLKSQAIALDVFYELLHHFATCESQTEMSEKEHILERLSEVIEYIGEHYTENISLEQIASHFYLSREYFSRFFKKNVGVTFTKYVNQVRLSHIYQDICNSSRGILEIAEDNGFTNYKLFNRMFHEVYGCSPREIRQRNRMLSEQEHRIMQNLNNSENGEK